MIMRWQAVIVLLTIVIGIVVPPALPLMTAGHGGKATIGAVDVCHGAAPALSAQVDMSCLNESPCNFRPWSQSKTDRTVSIPVRPLFIAFQDERPP
ncbi:MAG TPA: hypothetical protein VL197_15180, partial [Nitrospirota bacterium]|nr:hypothetical protein [Nitrospirota bacterium]